MRNLFTYTLACGLLLSTAAFAQEKSVASPGRSGLIMGGVTADETGRLDIVRKDIQKQLSDFMSAQRIKIDRMERFMGDYRRETLELCSMLLVFLQTNGATIPVGVSVPNPNVASGMTPEQVREYCTSVISIQNPPNMTPLGVTEPFLKAHILPQCNYQVEDLAWTGTQWECVNTVTGTGVCATTPNAMRPTWVPMQ